MSPQLGRAANRYRSLYSDTVKSNHKIKIIITLDRQLQPDRIDDIYTSRCLVPLEKLGTSCAWPSA